MSVGETSLGRAGSAATERLGRAEAALRRATFFRSYHGRRGRRVAAREVQRRILRLRVWDDANAAVAGLSALYRCDQPHEGEVSDAGRFVGLLASLAPPGAIGW